MKSINIIRQIYLYAVSIVSLFMIVFSAVSLLNLGLKTWVFTKADYNYAAGCDFAGYYGPKAVPSAPTPAPVAAPTAEEKASQAAACEAQKKAAADQMESSRQNELVRNISMLIVAVPLFWFHFRIVQRERKEDRETSPKAQAASA